MIKRLGLVACALCLPAQLRAATVSDLSVRQPIAVADGHYTADPGIRVAFALSEPAEVTVEIASHLAVAERSSDYLAKPPLVRALHRGKLEAGHHEVVWDGLDEKGQPVLQKFLKRRKTVLEEAEKLGRPLTPAELVGQEIINLFEIRVVAGGSVVATNFLRLGGSVSDSRKAAAVFDSSVSDGQGGYFASSSRKWRAWHYNAQGNLIQEYPAKPETWNGNVPVEAKQITVAHDKVYVLSPGNGILRYEMNGADAPWPNKADYVRGARLGYTVIRPRAGETTKLVISGSNILCDAAKAGEIASRPGFAAEWGGLEVDEEHVYLVRNSPAPELQIFDLDGKYLRSVPLPPDTYKMVRSNRQGKLWMLGPRGPKLIDPQTGALVRSLKNPLGGSFSGLNVGLDGFLYLWGATTFQRFTAEGEPAPYVHGIGNGLDPVAVALGLSGTITRILSIAGDQGGTGTVFTTDETKESGAANATLRVLAFDGQGDYAPTLLPDVAIGCQRPANVFVEAEPSRLALYFTSLERQEKSAQLRWTVTNYEGEKKQGTFDFIAAPLARQVVTVPFPADEFGFYQWSAELQVDQKPQASLASSAARIHQRDFAPSPDSPFGAVWGRDFYLMGLAGVKKERVGPSSWSLVEPFEGVLAPEVDDVTTGILAMRRDAASWGVQLSEMFTYGEPWTSKGWLIQLHSFDRYFKHVLSLVDLTGDKGVSHFQFWNEPNNFWKLPGPFAREHYSVVAKNCWSIVKARSKETAFICDGDATTFGMMQDLAASGAAPYNDAVECHYLGATGVTINAMKNNIPETKVASFESLVKLRDRFYPGKPILDTEEGVWGNRGLSIGAGAQSIPRVYIPLLAAGLDELDWFRFSGAADDRHSSYPLNDLSLPQPAYCSYASMTRALEGAQAISRIDLNDPSVFAYLFIRGGQAIVPIWCNGEPLTVELPGGLSNVTVTDIMDRTRSLEGSSLPLSENIQYLTFPCNAWTAEQTAAALKRQLGLLKVSDVSALPQEITTTSRQALSEPAAMSRLYYLTRAARLAAFSGDVVSSSQDGQDQASAHQEILRREGADAFLTSARLVLSWAGQLERSAAKQDGPTASRFHVVSRWIAQAASQIAKDENPSFPGVAVNAFIGAPGEIEKIRATALAAPDFPLIDPQFRYEIPRQPGESIFLELSVWDFYHHPVKGTISPRLPPGWTARPASQNFALQSGEFSRTLFEVTVPVNAEPGTFSLGGTALYDGHDIQELHTQRVKVSPAK